MSSGHPLPARPPLVGVRIAGTGSFLPEKRLTNTDLEKVMETSDEWIVQRTGIRERRVADLKGGQSVKDLAAAALRGALEDAGLRPEDLDLILVATMTPEMQCPPTACVVAHMVGAGNAGAMDLNAACCGFVFGMNMVHDLIRGGGGAATPAAGAGGRPRERAG